MMADANLRFKSSRRVKRSGMEIIMENNKEIKKIDGLELGITNLDRYLKTPGICECGNNYTYVGLGEYKCEHCGRVFKNEYAIVREFVDKYGTNYSIIEISEKTGISKKLIDMFVKDGKFTTVDRQRECIICHQPIDSGVYCKRCALLQTDNSLEENRVQRKMMSGTIRNEDMKGLMRYGRKV